MIDDENPSLDTPCSPAELSYAIRSARAVIEALIAHDQGTAEEAALRTCHDCDLLIRLIRDLATLLRDPLNHQFGFDPVATAALVRRANRVLALVDTSPTRNQSFVASEHDQDDGVAQVQNQRIASSQKQGHGAEPVFLQQAVRGRTVASLGLRVRLVPFEAHDNTSPAPDDRKGDASQPAPGDLPPRGVER
jgi:hypothetical protein